MSSPPSAKHNHIHFQMRTNKKICLLIDKELQNIVIDNDLDELQDFLQRYSKYDIRKYRWGAILHSLHRNATEFIKFLVEKCQLDVNWTTVIWFRHNYKICIPPPLVMFFEKNDHLVSPSVDYLIERGADLNKFCTLGINSPFFHALHTCRVSVIKHLIKKGGNIFSEDFQGNSTLIPAVSNRDINVIRYLISQKVNVNKTNAKGETVLHELVKGTFKPKMMTELIRLGARMIKDHNGCTPLIQAALHKNVRWCDFLFEHKYYQAAYPDNKHAADLEVITAYELLGISTFDPFYSHLDFDAEPLIHWKKAFMLRKRKLDALGKCNNVQAMAMFDKQIAHPVKGYGYYGEFDTIDEFIELANDRLGVYFTTHIMADRIRNETGMKFLNGCSHLDYLAVEGLEDQFFDFIEYFCESKRNQFVQFFTYDYFFNLCTKAVSDVCGEQMSTRLWPRLVTIFNYFHMFLHILNVSYVGEPDPLSMHSRCFDDVYFNTFALYVMLDRTRSSATGHQLVQIDTCADKLVNMRFPFDRNKNLLHFLFRDEEIVCYGNHDECAELGISNHDLIQALRSLIQRGLNVNAVDQTGNTPLHYLCFHPNYHFEPVVELLIQSGAHVDIRNAHDQIPVFALPVNPLHHLTLKCLCARVLSKQPYIRYDYLLPHLRQLVRLH